MRNLRLSGKPGAGGTAILSMVTFPRFAAIIVACSLVPGMLPAAEPAYRFERRVELPVLTEQELVSITLDADVYEAVQDGFPDLRLVDAGGQAVPYLLRTAAETRFESRRRYWGVREQAARPLDGGGLEILLTLADDDPPVSGVRLVSPLFNFEHRVRVFGSPNGQDWELLGEEGLIFDYRRFIDVRNETVPFPETILRHLRIVIDDVTAEQELRLLELTRQLQGTEETGRTERTAIERRPFRIDRLEVWQEIKQQRVVSERRIPYPVAGFRVWQQPRDGQTVVEIDTRREPLTRFTIETTTRNFSRQVTLEIPDVRGVQRVWRAVASGTLSQFDFKDLQRHELSLSFAEARQEQYRLVIDNRDSPPLEIRGLLAEGSLKELVFFAAPGAEFHLVYGDALAAAATHDTEAIAAALAEGYTPHAAALGPPSDHVRRRPFGLLELVNNPWVMLGIIVLLVVILGVFLYQAGQRLASAPDSSAGS